MAAAGLESAPPCLLTLSRQPPVLVLSVKGLTLAVRSVAGVHTTTCFPKNGIHATFDMGLASARAVGTPAVFVTHGHTDHVAALPSYVGLRGMNKAPPAVICAPDPVTEPLRAALGAFAGMAEAEPRASVEAMAPGDVAWLRGSSAPTVERGAGVLATAEAGSEGAVLSLPEGWGGRSGVCVVPVPTVHRVPSQGYAIVRLRQVLAERFRGTGGAAIAAARAAGEEVTTAAAEVVAAVTGDSVAPAVLRRRAFTEAPVLVTECTYAGGDGDGPEEARGRGHTHADELAEAWADRSLSCGVLVLTHFSARQGAAQNATEVRRALEAALERRGVALEGWRLDGGGDVEWGKTVPPPAVAGIGGAAGATHAPADDPEWPGRGSDAVMAVLCADCGDDEAAGRRRPTVVCLVHHCAI